MVQIVGRYQYVSNENFEEFMKALGRVELAAVLKSKPVVEVQGSGDQWSIAVNSNGRTSSATFTLGEPYEETLPSSDHKFQSVATKEGSNGFRIETQVSENVKIIRVYEFTDTEMIAHLSTNKGDLKATRTYKRL